MNRTGSQRAILLVEDNPADAELVLLALNAAALKARVDVVRDGAEALDYLFCRGAWLNREHAALPRLVLLDLKLPRMNGLEVLRQMKEHEETRAIPVVLLTSSRVERDLIEAYRLGVNSYVQKPLEFDRFRDVIALVGRYWVELNEALPGGVLLSERA